MTPDVRGCVASFVAVLLVALATPASAQNGDPCTFGGMKFPENLVVFAGGEYGGREVDFQIDQSGHQATQMDVVVNSPARPVALIFGAYEPTVWNIQWTPGTNIVAVLVGGYHRQVVAGLPKSVPVRIRAYDDGTERNESRKCGYFYISEGKLEGVNGLSRTMYGRPVEKVYIAQQGAILIGGKVPAGATLETSPDTPPSSYADKSAPLAGPAGVADAVRKGLLRPATAKDMKDWADAVRAATTPDPDLPPVEGGTKRAERQSAPYNTYVVLKAFTFPSGLYGGNSATFIIPKGVPYPQGNPGHSAVYDFNTLKCKGAVCGHSAAPVSFVVAERT